MGGIVYHVMNRGSRRGMLFESDRQYDEFESVLREAIGRRPIRLLNYCAMPNHFHLTVWPECDSDLPRFMHWLTLTHAGRWRAANNTRGQGAVYQARYRAIPVQTEEYFLTVARYVERNAVRAQLVKSAESWPWCSLWHREVARDDFPLAAWPVPRPVQWLAYVNTPQSVAETAAIRRCLNRGCGLGNSRWQEEIAKRLRIPELIETHGPKARTQR
jgi:putative transposase